LDLFFGNYPSMEVELESLHNKGFDMRLNANNEIILSGWTKLGPGFKFLTVKLSPAGKIDSNFGIEGVATPDFNLAHSQAISITKNQTGNYFIGGRAFINPNYHWAITKLSADGDLDTSFGNDGYLIEDDLGFKSEVANVVMGQNGSKLLAIGKRQLNPYDNYDLVLSQYFPETISKTTDGEEAILEPLLFPNAASNAVTLQFNLGEPVNLSIDLLDMQGKWLKSYYSNNMFTSREQSLHFDLPAGLPDGNYQLVLKTDKKITTLPLIIVH